MVNEVVGGSSSRGEGQRGEQGLSVVLQTDTQPQDTGSN